MHREPQLKPVSQLHFDLENPRYGVRSKLVTNETQALNMIVDEFGVEDLLSSITSNGFFGGEPLIVQETKKGKYNVLEGNRRLATLLILNGDKRAGQQAKRTDTYQKKAQAAGIDIPEEIPVLIIKKEEDVDREILAYLGTKHIVGPSEWDSYAKARWMAQMEDKTGLPLDQIKGMIGDTGRLVEQMLEGYYVIEQLKKEGVFDPDQSYVNGRGSNPEFPFSWVYTALSLRNVRRFIGIDENDRIAKDPVSKEFVENAGDLMAMMFGDKTRHREPVITESRDLGDLGRALVNSAKCAMLRAGEKLSVVEDKTRPPSEQLGSLLNEALERLARANGLLSEGLGPDTAAEFLDTTLKLTKAVKSFEAKLFSIVQSA